MDPKVSSLHPDLQTALYYWADDDVSFAALGVKWGISRQAAHKRVQNAWTYLAAYGAATPPPSVNPEEIETLRRENERLSKLLEDLRRLVVLRGALLYLWTCFWERFRPYFPKWRLTRFWAEEKQKILEWLTRYEAAGGSIKDFAKAIGRAPETLRDWRQRYEKDGLAGLRDKPCRPHTSPKSIPTSVMEELKKLVIRFPQWSSYQIYKYLRFHPGFNFSLSIPTIEKLRSVFRQRSEEEKERIKKRWAFASGADAWTIDFTCLWEDEHGRKLQLLTVSDLRSRFLFETSLFLSTSTQQVMACLEELFLKYGKPMILKADNGPEFRLDFREQLEQACVYLLNSPFRHPCFNGAHERIHRTLKSFLSAFELHHSLTRLVAEITVFRDHYNHDWTLEILGDRTPSAVYFSDEEFIPEDVEVIQPYIKDNELRMKFSNREGKPARMAIPLAPGNSDLSCFKIPVVE